MITHIQSLSLKRRSIAQSTLRRLLDHLKKHVIGVNRFVDWYNNEHLHSGINFVTPASRHKGEDMKQLKKRVEVYEQAKKRNPNRWSGKIRNWDYKDSVSLNPLKKNLNSCNEKGSVDLGDNYPEKFRYCRKYL